MLPCLRQISVCSRASVRTTIFMVLGPHRPFENATWSIEHIVKIISELLAYCEDNDYTYVEASQEAVDAWVRMW